MKRRFTPPLYERFEALLNMSDIAIRVEKGSSRPVMVTPSSFSTAADSQRARKQGRATLSQRAQVHILTVTARVGSAVKRPLCFERET